MDNMWIFNQQIHDLGIWELTLHQMRSRFSSQLKEQVLAIPSWAPAGWAWCRKGPPWAGLLAVSASRLCHCCRRPVNFCFLWIKPVWTLCSKLDGPDISIFFFFSKHDAKTWEMKTERSSWLSLQPEDTGKISNSLIILSFQLFHY